MSNPTDRGRGQAMVEFALVFMILAWGLFAIIDFGRWVYSANSLNEIARESARQGAVAYRPADCNSLSRVACVQTLAKNRLVGVPIQLSEVTVVCQRNMPITGFPADENTTNCVDDFGNEQWLADDIVRVEINSRLVLVTPLMSQFMGPAPIHGEAKVTVAS